MDGTFGRCPNQAQAREFLATLDVDEIYLDAAYDRCYCERCYRASFADTTGNEAGLRRQKGQGGFDGLCRPPLGNHYINVS